MVTHTAESIRAALRDAGVDLSSSATVEWFLYTRDAATAERAAVQLRACGHEALARRGASSRWWKFWKKPEYLCKCWRRLTPASAELAAYTEDVYRVGRSFGMEVDGWGAGPG